MNPKSKTCSECGGLELYATTVSATGGYGPMLLPQLGTFWRQPRFRVVVCATCGLTRFYAEAEARAKLSTADVWSRL